MTDTEKTLAERIRKGLQEAGLVKKYNDLNRVYNTSEDWSKSKYGVEVRLDVGPKPKRKSLDEPKAALVALVALHGMYSSDFEVSSGASKPFDIRSMEVVAEVMGTRNINIGQPECRGEGCETCGHNGHWVVELYVKDYKVAV